MQTPRKSDKGRRHKGGGGSSSKKRRETFTNDRARSTVLNRLASQAARFPDMRIEELDVTGLDGRDAAFARALYGTVMRRWLTLRALIEPGLKGSFDQMEPRIQAALLAGAAQMALLDRVPVHAAVDESVQWVKAGGGKRASGLVNAVLRRVSELTRADGEQERRDSWDDGRDEIPLEGGGALALASPVLPEEPLSRLAAATSCPVGLLESWTASGSAAETRRLALHSIVTAPVILNTTFASGDLPEALTPHNVPGHHVWTGSHAALSEFLKSRPDVWAQDPGSSLGVSSVTDLRPEVIIDPCAGLGTKTRQLRATFPDARIVATDIDRVRHETLKRVFADDDAVQVIPFGSLLEHAGAADLVLLDVPCSNTGVLSRRVEARYRFSRSRQEELAATQRQIIADAIPLLRSTGRRGRILYSTCSLDATENVEQARWAAKWHDFELSRERRRMPEGGPGEPATRYTDGAYAMLLE